MGSTATPRYSNSAGPAGAALLTSAGNARTGYMDTAAEMTRPIFYDPDISMVESVLEDQTKLMELQGRRVEGELDPRRAAARAEAENRILDLMDTDSLLQNELTKAGLAGAIGSGNYLSEGDNVGNAMAENIYGRGFMADYMQRLAMVMQYLEQNPEPAVNLDPATLATMIMQQGQGRADAFSNQNAYLTELSGQMMADNIADSGNAVNAGVSEAGANVNAYNASAAQDAQRKNAVTSALITAGAGLATGGIGALASGGFLMNQNRPAPKAAPVGASAGMNPFFHAAQKSTKY